MSQTLPLEADRRAGAVALMCSFFAAVAAVIVFFPAEGWAGAPAHAAIDALLGHAAFVVPLGLTLSGALGFALRLRPQTRVPRRNVVGLGLITIALLPADHLLGASTGQVGDWFTQSLLDMLGEPLTIALTLALLGTGTQLTFDLYVKARRLAAH